MSDANATMSHDRPWSASAAAPSLDSGPAQRRSLQPDPEAAAGRLRLG